MKAKRRAGTCEEEKETQERAVWQEDIRKYNDMCLRNYHNKTYNFVCQPKRLIFRKI